MLPDLPPPVIEQYGRIIVVRDDLLPGGTKRRFMGPLLARWPNEEFVYAGPAQGYAQLALAWAAADTGKQATVFVAARKTPHPLTIAAKRAGARIMLCRPGYLSVTQSRARVYAEQLGARLLPLGFDLPEVLVYASAAVSGLDLDAPEMWVTAGSGLLSRALQVAYPHAVHHAVQVGKPPSVGRANLWQAPEPFAALAEAPPPFPSAPGYDAKAWRFVQAHAGSGAVFWNVGA